MIYSHYCPFWCESFQGRGGLRMSKFAFYGWWRGKCGSEKVNTVGYWSESSGKEQFIIPHAVYVFGNKRLFESQLLRISLIGDWLKSSLSRSSQNIIILWWMFGRAAYEYSEYYAVSAARGYPTEHLTGINASELVEAAEDEALQTTPIKK